MVNGIGVKKVNTPENRARHMALIDDVLAKRLLRCREEAEEIKHRMKFDLVIDQILLERVQKIRRMASSNRGTSISRYRTLVELVLSDRLDCVRMEKRRSLTYKDDGESLL